MRRTRQAIARRRRGRQPAGPEDLQAQLLRPGSEVAWRKAARRAQRTVDPAVVDWLAEIVRRPGPRGRRLHALRLLAAKPGPRALRAIEVSLRAPDASLRRTAAEAVLQRVRWDPKAIPLANRLRQHGGPEESIR